MKDNKMYWPYAVVFRVALVNRSPKEWAVFKVFPSGKEEEVYRCGDPAVALAMFDRFKEEYRKEMEEK